MFMWWVKSELIFDNVNIYLNIFYITLQTFHKNVICRKIDLSRAKYEYFCLYTYNTKYIFKYNLIAR